MLTWRRTRTAVCLISSETPINLGSVSLWRQVRKGSSRCGTLLWQLYRPLVLVISVLSQCKKDCCGLSFSCSVLPSSRSSWVSSSIFCWTTRNLDNLEMAKTSRNGSLCSPDSTMETQLTKTWSTKSRTSSITTGQRTEWQQWAPKPVNDSCRNYHKVYKFKSSWNTYSKTSLKLTRGTSNRQVLNSWCKAKVKIILNSTWIQT